MLYYLTQKIDKKLKILQYLIARTFLIELN